MPTASPSVASELAPAPTTSAPAPFVGGLLTVDQIAPILGMSPHAVRNALWRGELPHLRLGKARIRFVLSEVLDHFRRVPATSTPEGG